MFDGGRSPKRVKELFVVVELLFKCDQFLHDVFLIVYVPVAQKQCSWMTIIGHFA